MLLAVGLPKNACQSSVLGELDSEAAVVNWAVEFGRVWGLGLTEWTLGAAVRLSDAAVDGGGRDRGLGVCLGDAFAAAAAEAAGGAQGGCWATPGGGLTVVLLGGFPKGCSGDAPAGGMSVAECEVVAGAAVDAAGVADGDCAVSLVNEPFLKGAFRRSAAGVLPLLGLDVGACCCTVGSAVGGRTARWVDVLALADVACAA